jgi:hypothetical protein
LALTAILLQISNPASIYNSILKLVLLATVRNCRFVNLHPLNIIATHDMKASNNNAWTQAQIAGSDAAGFTIVNPPSIASVDSQLFMIWLDRAGANYRSKTDGWYPLLQFGPAKGGYSYHFGTASNNVALGFKSITHEISLRYRFGNGVENRSLL